MAIWRHKWLVLTVLLALSLWLGLVFVAKSAFRPGPPRGYDDDRPTPPPNTISTHVLDIKSGKVELVRLVAEKDWEMACVVEEYADPLIVLQRHFNMRVSATTRPMIDEEWKFHLWKIVAVKGPLASVYYLDNRRIGRLSKNSCLPLNRAMLIFEPNADRIFVELVDKDARIPE